MKRILTTLIITGLAMVGMGLTAPSATAEPYLSGAVTAADGRSWDQPVYMRVYTLNGQYLGKVDCYGTGCSPKRRAAIKALGSEARVILKPRKGKAIRAIANAIPEVKALAWGSLSIEASSPDGDVRRYSDLIAQEQQ